MNDFLKILSREVDNPDHIYLYLENEDWYAYEHSACRLKQVVGECCIEQVISLAYQVVLVRARISGQRLEDELGDFLTTSPGVQVYDTHIEIPFRWQSRVVFDLWKQTELAMRLPCIELENV